MARAVDPEARTPIQSGDPAIDVIVQTALGDNAVQTEQQMNGEEASTAQTAEENVPLTDEDLEDYMHVGDRQHVRDLKAGIVARGDSPILKTLAEIRDFIRTSLAGGNKDTIKGYGRVGRRMANDLLAASDGKVDVSNYYLELDGNRLSHLSDHVETDDDPRNIPLTQEQAEKLTEYIDNYDDVLDVLRRKDGSTRFYLTKETEDGHIVILELVSKGRQSLQPASAWQNTKDAFETIWGQKRASRVSAQGNPQTDIPGAQNVDISTTQRATPEGQGARTSTDSIPQATTSVNGETNLPGDRPTMPEPTLPPMREGVDSANHPYGDNRQQNR